MKKVTQWDIANFFNVNQSYISKIINNKEKMSNSMARRLANYDNSLSLEQWHSLRGKNFLKKMKEIINKDKQ